MPGICQGIIRQGSVFNWERFLERKRRGSRIDRTAHSMILERFDEASRKEAALQAFSPLFKVENIKIPLIDGCPLVRMRIAAERSDSTQFVEDGLEVSFWKLAVGCVNLECDERLA